MSRLLIAEPPLQVLPTLARLVGLSEAIVLQQLHYHSLRSKDEGWVQRSIVEWHRDDFPFWKSVKTVERAFSTLRGLQLIDTTVVPAAEGRETKVRVNHAALEALTTEGGSGQIVRTRSGQIGGTGPVNLSGPRTDLRTAEKEQKRTTPPAPRKRGERTVSPTSRRKRDIQRQQRDAAERAAAHRAANSESAEDPRWERIVAELRQAVDPSSFDTWLSDLHPHVLTDSRLVVGAADDLHRWVADRFTRTLAACAAVVLGPDVQVKVETCDVREAGAA